MADKKVLLTGASGFIGRQLVKDLTEKGYKVFGIYHKHDIDFTNDNFAKIQLDLLNIKSTSDFLKEEKFENLIHMAWYGDEKCHTHNINLDWCSASLTLLAEFLKNGGRKVLMAGSVSEYDFKHGYFTEEITPIANKTLYGTSKSSLYYTASAFCKQNNIDFKWARIFNLFGPHERPQRLMPSVINSCLRGEDVRVSDCLKFQDYLYLKDVSCALICQFESSVQGAINICSQKPIELRCIVNKIAKLTDFNGEIIWGAIPAAFGEEVIVGNNKKLRAIGWEPQYTLEEGLKETINWWKNKNKGQIDV